MGKQELRVHRTTIKLRREELRLIAEAARRNGQTVSAWLRLVALPEARRQIGESR